jgi:hypothetical protein
LTFVSRKRSFFLRLMYANFWRDAPPMIGSGFGRPDAGEPGGIATRDSPARALSYLSVANGAPCKLAIQIRRRQTRAAGL